MNSGIQPFRPAQHTDSGPGQAASRLSVHHGFRSRFLPGERTVVVYLPPAYDAHPERAYPLLFMHDGQNLFDGNTSFIPGATWKMQEQADAAIHSREAEPLVIVGIHNAGDRRIAEYTHEPDNERGGGEALQYGRMLLEDLLPWIASQYRVRTDHHSMGLGGSSLGGLVTLYLALSYPQCFGKLAILSPSVWWAQKSILHVVQQRASALREKPRLWLDVGGQEGRRTVHEVEELAVVLKENGWIPGDTLRYTRVPNATHDEPSWARRVRPMLKFLFPARG